MRQWNAFQEDRDFVLENLQAGNLDHLEVVSRVVETQFFQEFIGSGALAKLAETYPTPRQKEEVPLWIYLATQLTLRLHGASGFASLPYILHCGGLRDALAGFSLLPGARRLAIGSRSGAGSHGFIVHRVS